MLGSIIGDIIGSRFEFMATQEHLELNNDFFHPACNFTDDTVCLSAITKTSLFAYDHSKFNKKLETKYPEDYLREVKFHKESFYKKKYSDLLVEYYKEFYMAGYGQKFSIWCQSEDKKPYYSLGNGCLMRISSIPMIFDSLDECKLFCDFATEITHDHPISIKMTHFYIEILWHLLTSNDDNENKKEYILKLSKKYELPILSVNEYKQIGGFNVLADQTLSRAIACVLESNSFKETIQKVLLIGSDTDTTACIAGAMAELLWGIDKQWLALLVKKFNHKNIILLKNILPIYSYKAHFSSHIKNNLFNENMLSFYSHTKSLELKDPTAEWDPLEDSNNDNYYSEADLALKNEMNKQKSLLQKIIDFFKKNN